MKVRDIFDIAVVDSLHHDLLFANLRYASGGKKNLLGRLANLSEDYCRRELAELDIEDEWRAIAAECLQRTGKVVASIPD